MLTFAFFPERQTLWNCRIYAVCSHMTSQWMCPLLGAGILKTALSYLRFIEPKRNSYFRYFDPYATNRNDWSIDWLNRVLRRIPTNEGSNYQRTCCFLWRMVDLLIIADDTFLLIKPIIEIQLFSSNLFNNVVYRLLTTKLLITSIL